MSRWEEGREGEREGALRACPACACEGASETMKIRYPKSKRRGLAGSGQSRGLGGEGRRGAALVARTPASTRARAHTHAHVCTQQDDCRLLLSPDDAAAVLQVQSGGPGPGVLSAAGGLGMGKESLSL